MSLIIFYILGGLILLAGLMAVTLRNIFHSALSLIAAFFLVAGIYVMLDAELLAAVQVLIYVGAVTILILFAIMLTHKIYAKAIRQANEQVIPALIISSLLLAIMIFTVIRTFGDTAPNNNNQGSWTGVLETGDLPDGAGIYGWSARLEDKEGLDYSAFGSFTVVNKDELSAPGISGKSDEIPSNGYIMSSDAGFSTLNTEFPLGQNIYLKIWSDGVDYNSLTAAEWHIFRADKDNGEPWKLLGAFPDENILTIELTNSNPESIGRLLMSEFVLPFEVVSVLLLAALIGAIVIARKEN